MCPVVKSLLADIARIGNSPISPETISNLRKLHASVMDFADSVVPKTQSTDREDFEDALNQLTDDADSLDQACDDYTLVEDNESKEEALEAAGEAAKDLAEALQELDPLVHYIDMNEKKVFARWNANILLLSNLTAERCKDQLDSILERARTPKETYLIIELAKKAIFSKR